MKKCFIEYNKVAQNVTVNVCHTPLVKDCNLEGDEICTTEYESECITEQHEHQVEDDVPECKTVVDEKCEDVTSGYQYHCTLNTSFIGYEKRKNNCPKFFLY